MGNCWGASCTHPEHANQRWNGHRWVDKDDPDNSPLETLEEILKRLCPDEEDKMIATSQIEQRGGDKNTTFVKVRVGNEGEIKQLNGRYYRVHWDGSLRRLK